MRKVFTIPRIFALGFRHRNIGGAQTLNLRSFTAAARQTTVRWYILKHWQTWYIMIWNPWNELLNPKSAPQMSEKWGWTAQHLLHQEVRRDSHLKTGSGQSDPVTDWKGIVYNWFHNLFKPYMVSQSSNSSTILIPFTSEMGWSLE